MNAHEKFRETLPFYVTGALDANERRALEDHLQTCAECQADLALWRSTALEVMEQSASLQVSERVIESALGQIRAEQTQPGALRRALDLLLSQIPLVRHEIWPASALIFLIGYSAAVLVKMEFLIQLIAPMVAAWGIAALYGPENDQAFELAAATPTHQAQILLARLAAVFGYNLALAVTVSLAAAPFIPTLNLSVLILSWLAPMTFLAALALLLSLWMSTGSAVVIPYLLWLGKFILGSMLVGKSAGPVIVGSAAEGIRLFIRFWENPLLLFGLAAVLLAGALLSLRWPDRRLPRLV